MTLLEESSQRLEGELPDMLVIMSPIGMITEVKAFSPQSTGYGPEELLGKHFSWFLHPHDLALVAAQFSELIMRPGMSDSVTARVIRKDRGCVTFDFFGVNLIGVKGINGILMQGMTSPQQKPV